MIFIALGLFLYRLFSVIAFIRSLDNFDEFPSTINDIYDLTDLNMFGCVIVFIILVMWNPLFLVAHFYTIYFILEWLINIKTIKNTRGADMK